MSKDTKQASEKISILDLLDDTQYRKYHVNVARYLKSVNAAIMLSELIGRYKYHLSRNELTEDGWFYHTHEAIESRTVLSRREQDSAVNILLSFGMIEKKLIGLPAKRHFKINELKILEMIGNDTNNSSLYKNAKLGCTTKNTDDLYKQDCTKTPNCIGGKRQTSHIIEESKEEPNKSSSSLASSSLKVQDKLKSSIDDDDRDKISKKNVIPSESVTYTTPKGETKTISGSEIYRHFSRFPYVTEIIQQAIAKFQSIDTPVSDPLAYLESVCKTLNVKKELPKKNATFKTLPRESIKPPKYEGPMKKGIFL